MKETMKESVKASVKASVENLKEKLMGENKEVARKTAGNLILIASVLLVIVYLLVAKPFAKKSIGELEIYLKSNNKYCMQAVEHMRKHKNKRIVKITYYGENPLELQDEYGVPVTYSEEGTRPYPIVILTKVQESGISQVLINGSRFDGKKDPIKEGLKELDRLERRS